MLALKVNDTFLDIDGASINLEINSPLFSFEITPGDFSYPFNIPPTSKNLIALKHIDVLEIENEIELGTFSAELFLLGNPYLQGELVVLSSNNKSIKVNFNGATSIFYKGIKNKLLTDYNPNPTNNIPPDSSYQLSYTASDYTLYEVINHEFKSDLPIYIGSRNYRAEYPNGTTAITSNDTSTTPNGGTYSFTVPMVYVFNYLQFIIEEIGYTLEGVLMDDAEIRTLTFLNNHSLNVEDISNASPPLYSFQSSGNPILNEHVPSVLVSELITAISKVFCCYVEINETNKVFKFIPLKTLIDSTISIDISEKVSDFEVNFDPKNGYILKHSPYSEISEVNYNQDGISGLNLSQYRNVSEDIPILELKSGNQDLQIDTGVSIPSSVISYVSFGQNRYLKRAPSITEKGFAKNSYDKTKFKDIVFLFYRGMQGGLIQPVGSFNQFFAYPYASYDDIDRSGTVIANYSLLWEGTNGLFEKWWKGWINFLEKNKSVKTKLLWGASDLLNADLSKKYYCNGSAFFIKKLSIKLTANTINSISAEMLKV